MRRKVILILIIVMLCVSLGGCKIGETKRTNQELMQKNQELFAGLEVSREKIAELEALLSEQGGSQEAYVGIEALAANPYRKTFKTVDNMVELPYQVIYPNAKTAPNESYVALSNQVTVMVSPNWIMQLDGTTLDLEHASGITGRIRRSMIDDMTSFDEVKSYLELIVNEIPHETLFFRTIFLGDKAFGAEVESETYVDNERYTIRMGILGIGGESLAYTFLYKGNINAMYRENILQLLNSIRISGMKVSVE